MSFIVSLSTIFTKFKDELSVFKKGENSYNSGHIYSVNFDGSLGILRGQVYASMKNKKYSVEVHLGQDGNIEQISCDCPRGLYQCHHMAALLMYANKNISSTDAVCSWTNPRSTNESPGSINTLYPNRQYQATSRPVSDEDKSFFLEELKDLNRFSGFFWLLQKEPPFPKIPWKTMQELIAQYNNKEDVLCNMGVTSDTIAEATVGQRNNALWHQMRLGRITASNFGAVINAVERNRFPPTLFTNLLGKNSLEGIKSIQWGINHEEVAIKLFEEVTSKKVIPTGIWLHSSGMLGASPDGLIENDAIIEVKCPYKHRLSTASDIEKDPKYCFDTDGNIKKTHSYYHQIQGQLYILNRSLCYLIIWTTIETIIIPVEKDPNWKANENILLHFYGEQFIHRIMT